MRLRVLYGLILGMAAGPPAARAQEGCARCHEKEHKAELGAAHAGGRVACVDCHGGDPRAADKERAHGPGYLGRIARPAMAGICGRCHSDPRRMNPAGLPTDQHAQYLISPAVAPGG